MCIVFLIAETAYFTDWDPSAQSLSWFCCVELNEYELYTLINDAQDNFDIIDELEFWITNYMLKLLLYEIY